MASWRRRLSGSPVSCRSRITRLQLRQQPCRFQKRYVLFLRYELKGIAAATTPTETVPAIFADADTECCFVVTFVNWARARNGVTVLPQLAHQAVVLQNLHHADFAFDRFEVNELGFLGHGNTPFKVQGMNKNDDSQKRVVSSKGFYHT